MKRIITLLTFAIVTVLFAISISASDFAVEASDERIFEPDGTKFYLPSYVSPSSVKLVINNSNDIKFYSVNGSWEQLENGDVLDLTPFRETSASGQDMYVLKLNVNGSSKTMFFAFADNLPSVHVSTTLGRDYIAANNAKDTESSVTIINKDGTYEYSDDTKGSTIKVRGNATKAYAKKPFQIKLTNKADLFEMGESRTWILLANYDDQSLIRNNVMYQIGSLLGMATCEFKSVDLWLDGQYYGVFLLCEKVSISSERINIVELEKLNDELNPTYSETPVKVIGGIPNTIITEYSYIDGVVNPTDITGGYLVELDNNYWQSELCYFITENGSHYVVKSPEYASKEQVKYIATIFGEMEEAIMSSDGYNRLGKHYSEYVDVNSLAYAYIVAELGRNYDAGSSSMYFYKDADKNGVFSKIVKGPLWDCDNTLGNIHKNGASNPEGYWARARSIWGGLTKHDEFNALVASELARVYDLIFDMIDIGGFVYREVEFIGQSIHMERSRWNSSNYSKWPVYYDGTHYDKWQSQAPIFNFVSGYYSYDLDKDETTVIGYLCEHLEARLNWLAVEWGCDVTIRERSFVAKPLPEQAPIIIEKDVYEALVAIAKTPILSQGLSRLTVDIIAALVENKEAYIYPQAEVGSQVGNSCPGSVLAVFDKNGLTGHSADPSKNFGKITVINFWGTWCPYCLVELPYFHQIADEYKDSVTVYAVHTTSDFNTASEYVKENFSSSDIVFLKDSINADSNLDSYYESLGGVGYYPYTVILDENGIISYIHTGAMTYEQLKNVIDDMT